MKKKYDYNLLLGFTTTLFQREGLDPDWADTMARTLICSDLMGHTTHGLQLLRPYLKQLKQGTMLKSGEPSIIADSGSAITWDGRHLPGPVLVEKAIDVTMKRLEEYPVATLAIQNSHHIACLAAYLESVTKKGKIIILCSSDPGNKTVAPYGGVTGTYSPDPIAYGIPTLGDPILFDSSVSTLANGQIMQRLSNEDQLDGAWLMKADGSLSDDPVDFFANPPATILPVGGLTLGFKGFGLAILIEALTSGLAGKGRRDPAETWSASVFLQLIDPGQFGGQKLFVEEMQHLVESCKRSELHPAFNEIRMPGERALRLKNKQMEEGIILHPVVEKGLHKCAAEYGISLN